MHSPFARPRRLALIPFILTLFVLLLYVPFTSAQQQDDEVERVSTDLVLVNVTVKDGSGRLVRGLKQAEFKLAEDSQPQTISYFGAESTPFAAVILLDTSGSMESRMSLARSAAARFAEGLRPG